MSKAVVVEQLNSVMSALAQNIKNQNYEKKANLKALAYKDELEMSDLDTDLQNTINGKADAATIQQQIDTQIGSVYKPGGSKNASFFAAAPTEAQLGYVYNVTEDFTTTADFLEGAGKDYTAGEDVAVVAIPGENEGDPDTYAWNVLSGFIDQTQFASATEFAEAQTKLNNYEFATDAEIQAIIDGIDIDNGTVTPVPNGDNLGY